MVQNAPLSLTNSSKFLDLVWFILILSSIIVYWAFVLHLERKSCRKIIHKNWIPPIMHIFRRRMFNMCSLFKMWPIFTNCFYWKAWKCNTKSDFTVHFYWHFDFSQTLLSVSLLTFFQIFRDINSNCRPSDLLRFISRILNTLSCPQ